jgi:hypothetical protein
VEGSPIVEHDTATDPFHEGTAALLGEIDDIDLVGLLTVCGCLSDFSSASSVSSHVSTRARPGSTHPLDQLLS